MTNKLKPCPFCGVPESDDSVNFDHHKDDCYLKMGLSNVVVTAANALIDTKLEPRFSTEQLYKAWNTREERTCHDVLADDEQFFRCSQCGCEVMLHVEVHTSTWNALWAGELNYCPNCGAKVVE